MTTACLITYNIYQQNHDGYTLSIPYTHVPVVPVLIKCVQDEDIPYLVKFLYVFSTTSASNNFLYQSKGLDNLTHYH